MANTNKERGSVSRVALGSRAPYEIGSKTERSEKEPPFIRSKM